MRQPVSPPRARIRTAGLRPLLAALCATWCVAVGPGESAAQEIQLTGPLAGAPVAILRPHSRAGQLDVGASLSVPLGADLEVVPLVGGRVGYGVTDRFLVGAWGAHAVPVGTPAPWEEVESAARIDWMVGPEVALVPARGKMAFEDAVFYTSLSLHAGPALAGIEERADCAVPCETTGLVMKPRTAAAASAALAWNVQPSRHVAFVFDWRVLLLERSRGAADVAGAGADGESPDGHVDSRDREIGVDHALSLRLSVLFDAELVRRAVIGRGWHAPDPG